MAATGAAVGARALSIATVRRRRPSNPTDRPISTPTHPPLSSPSAHAQPYRTRLNQTPPNPGRQSGQLPDTPAGGSRRRPGAHGAAHKGQARPAHERRQSLPRRPAAPHGQFVYCTPSPPRLGPSSSRLLRLLCRRARTKLGYCASSTCRGRVSTCRLWVARDTQGRRPGH